jgi:hypothetical protein
MELKPNDVDSILDVVALTRAIMSGDDDGFATMLRKMSGHEAKMRLKWATGILFLQMSEEELDRLSTRVREDEVWA